MIPDNLAEPWVPEGLKARLVVGARVSVRLNGGCLPDPMFGASHHPSFHCQTGEILDLKGMVSSHPYRVLFVRKTGANVVGIGWFAAAELDPL